MTDTDRKLVVCVGRALDHSNGKGYVSFMHLENGVAVGKSFGFVDDRKTANFNAGQTYRIRSPEEGKWILGGSEWAGEYADKVRVGEWQAQDRAYALEQRARKNEKKFGNATTGLDHHIHALALAYRSLLTTERLPFELWLLNELRKK